MARIHQTNFTLIGVDPATPRANNQVVVSGTTATMDRSDW